MRPTLWAIFLPMILTGCASQQTREASIEKQVSCEQKDPSRFVAGNGECLAYKAFGLETAGKNPVLTVFLHGDVSMGGPATYLYGYAEWSAKPGIVGVALLRPGYYDAGGYRSTGDDNGRRDNYTERNVDAIAEAIRRLKDRFGAKKAFLVGHSGGAAVAGVILGRHPGLVNGALLVSCPCDLYQWYGARGWRGAPQSLSPHHFIAKIPQGTRVVLLSGEQDITVYPEISKKYARALFEKGIKAEYRGVPEGEHRFATLSRSPLFSEAFLSLIGDNAGAGR